MKGSMNIFIPSSKHIDILNEIGRWKVISQMDLFKEVGGLKLYTSFCKTLRILERADLVKSFKSSDKRKYLTLSARGGSLSDYSASHIESEIEVSHDLKASKLLRDLLLFENFMSGHIVVEDSVVVPDALIYAKKNDREYDLAIELELTQKSKKRLVDKFLKYESSSRFDYVLYVTNKAPLFDSYRKVLLNMNEEIRKRIILMHDSELNRKKQSYLDSRIFFKGEFKKFTEVFL